MLMTEPKHNNLTTPFRLSCSNMSFTISGGTCIDCKNCKFKKVAINGTTQNGASTAVTNSNAYSFE